MRKPPVLLLLLLLQIGAATPAMCQAQQPGGGSNTTGTAPAARPVNTNEPFFAERYLSADQRLARRQQRILQVLKSADPLTTAP